MTQQFSTPLHDCIHKLIFNEINRYKVLQFVAQKKGFDLDKDNCSTSIDIERPIFSANQTRRFIIDGIIDLTSSIHCGSPDPNSSSLTNGNGSQEKMIKVKSFSGKELRVIHIILGLPPLGVALEPSKILHV